jgi:hypothetical protein
MNYYDIQGTKESASAAKKPYNCVEFGEISMCAKSSGKNFV